MLLENAFKCGYQDCLFYAMVTLVITILLMIAIHAFIYYKLVDAARRKYGNTGLPPRLDIDDLN
jgi:hypothetical protein